MQPASSCQLQQCQSNSKLASAAATQQSSEVVVMLEPAKRLKVWFGPLQCRLHYLIAPCILHIHSWYPEDQSLKSLAYSIPTKLMTFPSPPVALSCFVPFNTCQHTMLHYACLQHQLISIVIVSIQHKPPRYLSTASQSHQHSCSISLLQSCDYL